MEDISRKIEQSAEKPAVTEEVAEKEEAIAKTISNSQEQTERKIEKNVESIVHSSEEEFEERKQKEIIEKRKEKIIAFVKKPQVWVLGLLIVAVILGVYIRSMPMHDHGGNPGLWDVTTDNWTLGPDLDPWLFLRTAKSIDENGSIPKIDTMRNVPLGFDNSRETMFLPYLIYYTYTIVQPFYSEANMEFAGALLPIIMFALTIISFFLFVREIFIGNGKSKERKTKANAIAIISTFFMIVTPVFLSRTIAGIPEKESAAFFFMFLSFYLFLKAWKSEKLKISISWALAAGVSTALMALIWGGYIFIYLTIGIATFIAFMLGKIEKRQILSYGVWIAFSIGGLVIFSNKYNLESLLTSIASGSAFFVLILIVVHLIIWNTKIKKYFENFKVPRTIVTLGVTLILGIIGASVLFGPDFIIEKIKSIQQMMFKPVAGRWNTTVAENRQPFFNEWASSFGPYGKNFKIFEKVPLLKDLPFMLWMFILGGVALFKKATKKLGNKNSWILTGGFFVLLMGMIFSRYTEGMTTSEAPGIFFIYLASIIITGGILIIYLGKELSSEGGKIVYSIIKNVMAIVGFIVLIRLIGFFVGLGILPAGGGIILLFFLGGGILAYAMYSLEKNFNIDLTIFTFIILLVLIFSLASVFFSQYVPLNGENLLSKLVYYGAVLVFLFLLGKIYFEDYKKKKESFHSLDYSFIFVLALLLISIFSARGAVRLIMVLGPISGIFAAYILVESFSSFIKSKDESKKMYLGILFGIILIASVFTFWSYYQSVTAQAYSFVPSAYNQQWQYAMDWTRDNTSEDAVFGHWWDYGYWVQSIGNRATVLDGGNAQTFWNYYMGRHVLTGDNERDALEFLYAHNTTHFLIDSTDIGKYGAFSQIGSDENFDRLSWISTMQLDPRQTQETQNKTIYVYTGGIPLDEDLIIEKEGKEVFLPANNAFVAGVLLNIDSKGNFEAPSLILYYNGQQYETKAKYLANAEGFSSFEQGIEATVYLLPTLEQNSQGIKQNPIGAVMYLSPRVMRGMLAQNYILNDPFEKWENFELVHTEDNLFIKSLNSQGMNLPEFIYYQGVQGPIKIWEVSYPEGIEFKEKYLETDASKYLSWQL